MPFLCHCKQVMGVCKSTRKTNSLGLFVGGLSDLMELVHTEATLGCVGGVQGIPGECHGLG